MTTFSQLIDSIVAETKRLDLRSTMASYLNQTIRECHFEPEKGNVVFMTANYNEETVQADSDTGFAWTIPDMATFQGIGAIRFDNVFDYDEPVYAAEVTPGRRMAATLYGYQRAADRVIFKGYGGENAYVSVCWYQYPSSLKYYAAADRPASYDSGTWTYHEDYDIDDDSRAAAILLVTNWMLLRWGVVLEEGLRAKVYKRLSDDSRARVCYSLYTQQRQGLITSEAASGAF